MAAKRAAFQPLSGSRVPERKGAADRAKANPQCCASPAHQEPEKEAAAAPGIGGSGIHRHVMGAVGGPGAVDESSDSEGEQEGPQKLIRKVSTSGQIRSKVRNSWRCQLWPQEAAFCGNQLLIHCRSLYIHTPLCYFLSFVMNCDTY